MLRSFTSRLVGVSNPREVWLVTTAHGVNEFYSVVLPPILPLLVNDFDISYAEAGALVTVFFVTYSIFQLPSGVLADHLGKRWLLAGGMVTLSGGILLAAGAQDYSTLLAAEALAGVGGSTYHPTGMSIISDLENADTEGKAMGIHGLGGVAGTALAPALVGGLGALFGWRLALTVSAAVGVVFASVFLALFRGVDEAPGAPVETDGAHEPVETEGAAPTDGEGGPATDGSGSRWRWTGGLASVPRERWVLVLFVANLAIATQIGAVRTFITSYLVEHAGTTTGVANGIFFVMLVGAGVSSVGAGALADSVDRRTLGLSAMAASALVLAATALVPAVPLALFAWFFLLGVAMWAAVPAMNAITSRYSEREFSGSLFGVLLTAGSFGGASGPLLFGAAAGRYGLGTAFSLVAIVSLVGAAAFLVMRRL